MAHSSSSAWSVGKPREVSEEWGEAQLQNSLLSLYFDLVTLKAEPGSRQGRHSTAVWGQRGHSILHPLGPVGILGKPERV